MLFILRPCIYIRYHGMYAILKTNKYSLDLNIFCLFVCLFVCFKKLESKFFFQVGVQDSIC